MPRARLTSEPKHVGSRYSNKLSYLISPKAPKLGARSYHRKAVNKQRRYIKIRYEVHDRKTSR